MVWFVRPGFTRFPLQEDAQVEVLLPTGPNAVDDVYTCYVFCTDEGDAELLKAMDKSNQDVISHVFDNSASLGFAHTGITTQELTAMGVLDSGAPQGGAAPPSGAAAGQDAQPLLSLDLTATAGLTRGFAVDSALLTGAMLGGSAGTCGTVASALL